MFPVTCQAASHFLETRFLHGGEDAAARTDPAAVK